MAVIDIKSKIKNINIVIGCTNRCPYCYARCTAKRFHITDDFSVPQFYESKLRLLENPKPLAYLLTGMSDFADWTDEWKMKIFERIARNPQNQFLFLTKSPERISFDCDLDNVWMGVTVTRAAELKRIRLLKENVKCKHYHVTFEPLHEDVGEVNFDGIDWTVIGTETGKRKGKISAKPEWVENIVRQAQTKGVPVFMKEELAPIMGDKMIQQYAPNLICEVK